MNQKQILFAATLLLATGIAQANTPPPEWIAGDIHVHATGASWDGDDKSFPEAIKKVALERGIKFVVLTDHSDATGSKDASAPYYNLGPEFPYWEKAAALSETDKFLMIDGNEISPLPLKTTQPAGHIGCIPIDLAKFDTTKPFTDRPQGKVPTASVISQCRKIGGFVIVNHAYSPAPWTEFDWTSRDYDALEVFNGGMFFDRWDKRVIEAGLCDWALGKKTIFLGGSDTHRVFSPPGRLLTEPALGTPTTFVKSPKLAWPEIMSTFKANKVVVGTSSTFFDASLFEGQTLMGEIGGTVKGAGKTLTLRAKGYGPTLQKMEIRANFVPKGGCEDRRQPGRNISPKLEQHALESFPLTLNSKGQFDLTAPLRLPGPGVLHLVLQRKTPLSTELHVAIANPIMIE